ncbi:MAG: molybdate ABC transporter substrate-binding protein, partial [Myxococcota bacterium]
VIVPEANPARIDAFADLSNASRIVIGSRHVPVGIYTRELLDRAGAARGEDFVARIEPRIVSEENNVRLVRAKVELGEADAAIVYRTDALASDRVRLVPIPDELQRPIQYFVGRLNPRSEARAFVDYLRSRGAQRILRRHGFREAEE